jgi:glycosyltransferase involved in cell wall biosynthesis
MTSRLLVVTDTLGNGGAERQLALTVTNLPTEWDVRCFSVGGGPFAAYLAERGVDLEIAERSWHYDPLPFLRLWSVVRRWRPHLVHSWGYMTTLAGLPAYRVFRIPFIDGSIRTGDYDLTHRSRSRAGLNRASLVVANSQSGLVSAGVSPDRGRVIRNGFDFTRIPVEAPLRKDNRFTVVMAARMHPHKDHACLLSAVRILVGELGPSALRCVLLGDGPDRARLESENRDLVEAGVVEFGSTPDVVPELLVSDCGVIMTARDEAVEGCSNAILEYMAAGLPVICSKGGGTDELVAHGETGFLVTPGDSQELARWLRWVYLNPPAANAIGLSAARRVKDAYSVEAMIRATEDVYAEALARGA